MHKIPLLLLLGLFLSSCYHSGRYELPQLAEELTRQGDFERAIQTYELHIQNRLNYPRRPTWENPYFYLLPIGDIQLQQGKFAEALQSFELAEKHAVDRLLVSDRYRYVASLYERDGKLNEAIEILSRYRDRDPLLYDLVRDRVAKALLRAEDERAAASSASPSPTSTPSNSSK